MPKVGRDPKRIQDQQDFAGPVTQGTSGLVRYSGGVFSTTSIVAPDLPDASSVAKGALAAADKIKIDARTEYYASEGASGAGTTSNKWTGWEAGVIAAVSAGRRVVFTGVFATATGLSFNNKRLLFRGENFATICYTGSLIVEAVLRLSSTGVPINGDNIFAHNHIEGINFDGGSAGKARYGISVQVIHSSTFRRLNIGNTTDGLVLADDAGYNVWDHVISHKDQWTTMPTNGFVLMGAWHSKFDHCDAGPRAGAAVGRGFWELTSSSGNTPCFNNTYVSPAATNQATGFYQEVQCWGDIIKNSGFELCTNTFQLQGYLNQVNGGDHADAGGAVIAGTQNTLRGGYYPFTITISGQDIKLDTVHYSALNVTGVGDVEIINPIEHVGSGSWTTYKTATKQAHVALQKQGGESWYGAAGDLHIAHETSGGKIRLGNTADDNDVSNSGRFSLDIGRGVSQIVIATDHKLEVEGTTPNTIIQAVTNSGNDLWFGNTSTNVLFTCGAGKQIDFYVNGAADYAMNIAGVNLSMRNHRIMDLADPTANTDAASRGYVLGLRGVANGICDLDGSALIPTSRLPHIAYGDRFTVASQAAMLALSAQMGDVAKRTDLSNRIFFLSDTDPTVLASWIEIGGAGTITSVNGQAGPTVNLVASDVGAAPTTRSISTGGLLSGGGDLSANRTITTSMSTGKLVGRFSAGTGVMQEITLGTKLSFSGATLNVDESFDPVVLVGTTIDSETVELQGPTLPLYALMPAEGSYGIEGRISWYSTGAGAGGSGYFNCGATKDSGGGIATQGGSGQGILSSDGDMGLVSLSLDTAGTPDRIRVTVTGVDGYTIKYTCHLRINFTPA